MLLRRRAMTEGTVSWNDYCPKCKKSTRLNFAFGKIRLCDDCQAQNLDIIKQTKGGQY